MSDLIFSHSSEWEKGLRGRRRQVGIVLLAVLFLVLVFGVIYMAHSIWNTAAVTYTPDVILPERADLCYGEELVYTTSIVVHRAPVILHVVENFCEPGEKGLCFRSTVSSYEMGINETKNLTATIRRVIPASPLLTPGEEFVLSHVAEDGAVTGYQVPFRIRKDCKLP